MREGALTEQFVAQQLKSSDRELYYDSTENSSGEIDFVISMGCNVGCPFVGRAFDDNWGLEDPTGKSDEEFMIIIKKIENNILQLKNVICIENAGR